MEQEKTNDFAIGKAYVVQWVDSCGTPAGWIDLSDYDYPTDVMEITTYGTVINKSDNAIVLAQSYNEGNGSTILKQAMGIVVIPFVCITNAEPICAELTPKQASLIIEAVKQNVYEQEERDNSR